MNNLDIGLNAKLNEFIEKFNLSKTENKTDAFEEFGNYVIGSNLLVSEIEDLRGISTEKAQGIDGIVIIVNDRLIQDIDDLLEFGTVGHLSVKIGFIQSTLQKSFDQQKLKSFTDEVIKFLNNSISIEPFSQIYHKLMNDLVDRLADTPEVKLFFLSGRTRYTIPGDLINGEKDKFELREDISGRCNLSNYQIYQCDDIKNAYDKIIKYHSVELTITHNVQLPEVSNIEISLLSIIKFSDLEKLILTPDGYLRDSLFQDNVRNFIGETPVNKEIKKTLESEKNREFFPYLNNGLVIICDSINRHPVQKDKFILKYPRIINGCQTTNVLYKYSKEASNSMDDIFVVAKIIATNDKELRKRIVFAANNQNAIEKDLQSLNDYHEEIEQYYNGIDTDEFKLHFERLRGQCSQVTPPYSKITIETIARVYISTFLRMPNTMKSSALKKIEEHQEKGNIFQEEHPVEDYYYCGLLSYWLNYFIVNKLITLRSKTMDMHILTGCHLVLDKNYKTTNEKIDYLKQEANALSLFQKIANELNTKEYLFERRGFYSQPKVNQLVEEIEEDANLCL